MDETRKYPKTLHVPFSKGITTGDRKCEDGWFDYLKITVTLPFPNSLAKSAGFSIRPIGV